MIDAVFGILIPAGIANIMASLSRYIFPRWNRSINSRLLGAHKTWRGLVCGIFFGSILGLLILYVFYYLRGELETVQPSMIKYQWQSSLVLATGALLGDLVKSFFKRRMDIVPGKPWIPFDQLDWLLGAFVAYSIYRESFVWSTLIALLVIGGVLHVFFNVLGRLFHLQKNWL